MNGSNAVALQMPSSYVLMSNEEMEYIEGGTWKSYTGTAALGKLSEMIFTTIGLSISTAKLGSLSLGLASTGLGVFSALACAIGAAWSAGPASINALMTGTAAYYYYKYNGFSLNSSIVPVIAETFYSGIRRI